MRLLTVMLLFVIISCIHTNDNQLNLLYSNYSCSQCHGFLKQNNAFLSKTSADINLLINTFNINPATYNNGEYLYWLFSESADTLYLLNTRKIANCESSFKPVCQIQNSKLAINEINHGLQNARCICAFDIYIAVPFSEIHSDTFLLNGKEYSLSKTTGRGIIMIDSTKFDF
jgi:hypothetical protein